ncbi:MAG: thioredoxin domain-containing protein [Bacillota bacterium]|nr:thioredoxin domain-containing protein [Bacillota bacterium]
MTKPSKKSSTSTKIIFWVLGFIVIFILGFIFFLNHAKNKPAEAMEYKGQPFLGKSSAPVSIVEFGDYKCPNCKHFAEMVVPVIEKEIVKPGKAKFYFMNDSFINVDSIRAAKFAEAVYMDLGNDTFWKFHELLYKKQPEESKYEKMDYFTEAFLTATLNEVATKDETNKVVASFRAKKTDAAWQKDMDFGEKLGVSGTPTLFVNGKLFDGNTIDDLKKMVDDAAKGKKNE